MRQELTPREMELLKEENIIILPNHDYTFNQVNDLLEKIALVESSYAQDSGSKAARLAEEYGDIYDKVQDMIPEV